MSVLASAVITQLQTFLGDSSDAQFTAAEKLTAINAAILDAFPTIANVKRDSSITLDSQTFTYTPSATPEMEQGFAAAYVAPLSSTTDTNVRLERGVRQVLATTTWTIVVAPYLAQQYHGKALYLDYNSRVAQVMASTDSIELPLNYLWQYAAWYLMQNEYLKGKHFDTDPYGKRLDAMERRWQAALLSNRRGLPERLPIGYEFGAASLAPEPISQVNSVRI